MTDATKPAGDLVRSLRSLGADFRSHPVANGTIERTEEAGELMHEAADEIDRLTAALADRERAIAEAVAAEREAARLACASAHGYADTYAVFELVAVVKGKVLADTDRVQGMGTCKALVPKWDDAPGVEV